ncbi:hypothetical protein R1flu_010407 [Riccia fluitans]|uniref:Xyloglucan endotransglucosylase/hydrolase n=1 Tax=Riccia fluitans TaxID=41844 RepID=A0ABD1Z522_9MARC
MDPQFSHGLFRLAALNFMLLGICSCAPLSEIFTVEDWARKNVVEDDATGSVRISLTPDGGGKIESRSAYLGGSFSVRAKLISGESAGTVSAFYLISQGENHDEIDMEFLGNISGQPYLLHTNIFANGVGNREQQVYLPFDPTADFHTYSVICNHQQITWLVDGAPIRIYRNIENIYPSSYPFTKGMHVAASIYEASTWATRGGLVPINWNYAPFEGSFDSFNFEACEVPQGGDTSSCEGNYGNWWDGAQYQSLSPDQVNQLRSFQQRYMIYNYCTDQTRYATPPVECAYNAA